MLERMRDKPPEIQTGAMQQPYQMYLNDGNPLKQNTSSQNGCRHEGPVSQWRGSDTKATIKASVGELS